MNKYLHFRLPFLGRASSVVILACTLSMCIIISSCGNSNKGEETSEQQLEKAIDTSNVALGVGGKIFIIPSPMQTALLIQQSGAKYDKAMLNKPDKANSYSTKFQKCLNLGIYGADLGYLTLYDQTNDALHYFKAVNTLATALNLSNAFDKSIIERFQKNVGKKDSMLVLVSSAYRSSNDFLRNNARKEEAALIIAGGWIETLQFTLNILNAKNSEELKRRIAEQKMTLNNLIALISAYNGNDEYTQLLNKLNDLKLVYDKVGYNYIYEKPTTDSENKSTTITSKSETTITPEIIKAISEKVADIRGFIVA